MKFQKCSFHDGINITVRRGARHYNNEDTEFGSYVFNTVDSNAVGFMTTITYKHIRFTDLANDDLRDCHDEGCRTMEGLKKAMETFYDDFDVREIVTLIYFTFKPWTRTLSD